MNSKTTCAGILGIVFLVIFITLVIPHALSWPVITPGSGGIDAALWKGRTYEVLLQGIIILAGVMAILLLLGLKQSGKEPP
jgi:ABC-type Fe3+ transport system permease subunit